MTSDVSEKIDEYCQEKYGHTNWGYLETYSQEKIDSEPYDIEGNIIFWHYELEDDEENNNKGEQK
jgi:hypothetical protein